MKKILLVLTICFLAFTTNAQIKAVTEKGDEVLLYDNGTWSYSNAAPKEEVVIPENPGTFTTDKASSFLVKSDRIPVGININPKLWSFKKAGEDEAAEFEFQLKNEDLYMLLITEKIEIPVESLSGIAFENAQSAAPDAKIVAQEYRMVNGVKLLMMQMEGTIQGVKFKYFGYYYGGPAGAVQVLCYTASNLFDGYKDEMETLLNGFVVKEK
jgi:hypothetical protein